MVSNARVSVFDYDGSPLVDNYSPKKSDVNPLDVGDVIGVHFDSGFDGVVGRAVDIRVKCEDARVNYVYTNRIVPGGISCTSVASGREQHFKLHAVLGLTVVFTEEPSSCVSDEFGLTYIKYECMVTSDPSIMYTRVESFDYMYRVPRNQYGRLLMRIDHDHSDVVSTPGVIHHTTHPEDVTGERRTV